ncbi:MAG TPA: hypothetical protein VGC64_10505, partial [Pyrinomonadaceae bacterium]
SPYHMQASAYGLDLHPCDFYKLIYPFDDAALARMAYYFTDRNVTAAYVTTMVEWIGRIREKFSVWSERWHGTPEQRPQLRFLKKGGATLVYDSRSGTAVEHELSDAGQRVLEHLEKPNTIKSVAAIIPGSDAERELAALCDRRLLFQEDNRYMSLVLSAEPKAEVIQAVPR